MNQRFRAGAMLSFAVIIGVLAIWVSAADPIAKPIDPRIDIIAPAPLDAVADAQTSQPPAGDRPEQRKQPQDQGDKFDAGNAPGSSTAFDQQPDQGKIKGFDFYRDPLNAKTPGQTPDEIMKQDVADKPKVMEAQKKLLESRYNLQPKFDPEVKMSRGKPVPMGPTARLPQGVTFEQFAAMLPDAIRTAGNFPYPPLPHPKQVAGGQVFPQVQLQQFARLTRFDVDFDLPEAFIPEFPPAIFLSKGTGCPISCSRGRPSSGHWCHRC